MERSSSRWRFMNPFEYLKLIYETFGAKHPTGSLILVMTLGGLLGVVLFGGLWVIAANQYAKSATAEQPQTINTTSGSQNQIIPNNDGNVTISNETTQSKQPPTKDKPK